MVARQWLGKWLSAWESSHRRKQRSRQVKKRGHDVDKKIDPRQLIKELSLEELCQTAEEYFRAITDPTPQMAKPFASTLETPQILYKMGLLLYGLRLGKSMVVLDFGAGTCWFSRLLNQMQCVTISVDVSETALELGKKLFEISPIVGEYLCPPQFVLFDGRRMEVPDDTVDRIISFDAFHHVPNQRQVLGEFFRVLKPGGIVGFSEPGIKHSQTTLSQYEMRKHTVLENDIRLDEIKAIATDIGFSDLRVKLTTAPQLDLDYDTYAEIIEWPLESLIPKPPRPRGSFETMAQRFLRQKGSVADNHTITLPMTAPPVRIFRTIVSAMRDSATFFLTKGTYIPDSRSHEGLKHQTELLTRIKTAQVGQPLELKVRLENVGSSKWLCRNIQDIGVVKIGVHLLGADERLIENDFARGNLRADVMPGQTVTEKVSITFTEPGEYILSIDLVSEHVCWFELFGSRPQHLRLNVT
jgi:SAM-dependent methyltransferase